MNQGGTGAKIFGIIFVAVLLAGVADLVKNPTGTSTLFKGTNSLLSSTYQAASGSYAKGPG